MLLTLGVVNRVKKSARTKAGLGRAYVDGKLQVPGMSPLPVPQPPNPAGRNGIQALLEKPLQKLTVDAQGNLVLPPLASLPVIVTDELKAFWKSVRAEFPYPDEMPAKRPAIGDAKADQKKTETTGTTATAVAPGTKLPGRNALKAADWFILQESPSVIPGVTLLLAKNFSDGNMHVFLENTADNNIKVKAGTFVA